MGKRNFAWRARRATDETRSTDDNNRTRRNGAGSPLRGKTRACISAGRPPHTAPCQVNRFAEGAAPRPKAQTAGLSSRRAAREPVCPRSLGVAYRRSKNCKPSVAFPSTLRLRISCIAAKSPIAFPPAPPPATT
jgi:hypothetical protein